MKGGSVLLSRVLRIKNAHRSLKILCLGFRDLEQLSPEPRLWNLKSQYPELLR